MVSQNTLVSLRPPKAQISGGHWVEKKGGPFSFCCTVKEAPRSGSLPWVGQTFCSPWSKIYSPTHRASVTHWHNLCLSHWLASDTGEIFCAVSARVADLPKGRRGKSSNPIRGPCPTPKLFLLTSIFPVGSWAQKTGGSQPQSLHSFKQSKRRVGFPS